MPGVGKVKRLVIGLGTLAVSLATAGCGLGADQDSVRWDALPHTMGCALDPADRAADPPGSALVREITLSHVDPNQLQLDVEFNFQIPPEPGVARNEFGPTDAPGSILTDYLIEPHHANGVVAISGPRPSIGQGWYADVSEFDSANPDVLTSVATEGRILTLRLDLSNQPTILGEGEFKADIQIVQMVAGRVDSVPNIFPVRGQNCGWNTPARETPEAPIRQPVPQTVTPTPFPEIPPPLAGMDASGFREHPGARCEPADELKLAQITSDSTLVVCLRGSNYYYRGSRLSDGASIALTDVTEVPGGFDAVNTVDGTRYQVRGDGLTIITAKQTYIEPAVELWQRDHPSAPVPSVQPQTQYVITQSRQVRCAISQESVACERNSADGFPQAPASTGGAAHWNLATVDFSGAFAWAEGNIGGADPNQDVLLAYGTVEHFNGWNIEASADGTRFTNAASGRGMFVSIERVDSF